MKQPIFFQIHPVLKHVLVVAGTMLVFVFCRTFYILLDEVCRTFYNLLDEVCAVTFTSVIKFQPYSLPAAERGWVNIGKSLLPYLPIYNKIINIGALVRSPQILLPGPYLGQPEHGAQNKISALSS